MSIPTMEAEDLARAERRLPWWMAACALAGLVATTTTGHLRFALGFSLGAGTAILSYRWLHETVEALMTSGQSRVPRRVVAKFLVRYPLSFGVVSVFYWTRWVPFAAVLAGLFVPVAGVLIEAVAQLREGLIPRDRAQTTNAS